MRKCKNTVLSWLERRIPCPQPSTLPTPVLTRATTERTQCPTFTIPARTFSIDVHAHHHWHSSKPRSLHHATQPRAAQRQCELDTYRFHRLSVRSLLPISDGYEACHSVFFSPLSHLRLSLSCPSLHNRELYSSFSSVDDVNLNGVNLNYDPNHARAIHEWHRKPTVLATVYAAPAPSLSLLRPKRALACPHLIGNDRIVHLCDAMIWWKKFWPECCSS